MAKLLFLQNLEYELLGPMYISSMVKRHGHECSLALGKHLGDFAGVIEEYCPDIIGFSIMSGSGPTVFGVFTSVKDAENASKAFKEHWTAVVQTLTD